MKRLDLFRASSTIRSLTTFMVEAKDIKQALTKAENLIRQEDGDATITKIEAVSTKLLEED